MKFNIKSLLIFLLGILIMTLGVSLTVKSEVGAGAYDSICIIIAFALKGPIGIGTIIATILIGPLIDIINKLIIRMFPQYKKQQ